MSFLIYAFAAICLIWLPQWHDPFNMPRLWLQLAWATAVIAFTLRNEESFPIFSSRIGLGVGLALVCTAVLPLYIDHSADAQYSVSRQLLWLVMFWIGSRILHWPDVSSFLRSMIWVALPMLGLALAQLSREMIIVDNATEYPVGTFGNRNWFAEYLIVIGILSASQIHHADSKLTRWVSRATTLLCVALLLVQHGRTGLLIGLPLILVALYRAARIEAERIEGRSVQKLYGRIAVGALLFFGGLSLGFWGLEPIRSDALQVQRKEKLERISKYQSAAKTVGRRDLEAPKSVSNTPDLSKRQKPTDGATSEEIPDLTNTKTDIDRASTILDIRTRNYGIRLLLWRNTLRSMISSPFGIGPDQFRFLAAGWTDEGLSDALLKGSNHQYVRDPHNEILRLGIEYGWLTSLIWLLGLFWMLRLMWETRNSSVWPLSLASCGVLASSMLNPTFANSYVWGLTAVMMGLVVGSARMEQNETTAHVPGRRLVMIGVITFLLLVALLMSRRTIAEVLAASAHRTSAKQAVGLLERASRIAPQNPQIAYKLATALSAAGLRHNAQVEYSRAIALFPHFREARVARARLFAELGQKDRAITEVAFVVRHWPEAIEAQLLYTALLLETGALEQAGNQLATMRKRFGQESRVLAQLAAYHWMRKEVRVSHIRLKEAYLWARTDSDFRFAQMTESSMKPLP